MARKYELKRRAERVEETRQRIVQATVELHEELGPARTSISAIAERAGVERLTVYRHFPDEEALFSACTQEYWQQHPLPDPERWAAIADPMERLAVAMTDLYAHFAETEEMTVKGMRDLPLKPALAKAVAAQQDQWRRMHEVLTSGWGMEGARAELLAAAVGHAIDFRTWHALVRGQGLSDEQARLLMLAMVNGVLNASD